MDALVAAATAGRLSENNTSAYQLSCWQSALERKPDGDFFSEHYTDEMFNNAVLRVTDKLGAFCHDLLSGAIKEIVYSLLSNDDQTSG